MPRIPTVGVEEEFLLLDPLTGRPVPAAPEVLRRSADTCGPRAEVMRYQVEVATGVCGTLAEVGDQLWTMRRKVSVAAAAEGCRLVACGISPYANPGLAFLTDEPRYHELARRYPGHTAVAGTCACQIHVAVPDRDTGVRVLAWLRPWLATLLAASANSPISAGRLSGWSSRRYAMISRWPTGRPPEIWQDGGDYAGAVRKLIEGGAAMDERSIYFLARLSPRYPTVEVRVTDVCPDVDTAVLIVGLVRALVMTARQAVGAGLEPAITEPGIIEDGLLAAARAGLGGPGIDVGTGAAVAQYHLLQQLRGHVDRALHEAGDVDTVDRCLALLAERGTGADRQLSLWRADPSPASFVRGLARGTLTAPMHLPSHGWQAPRRSARV